jgi:SAM-dependent methyltransferase
MSDEYARSAPWYDKIYSFKDYVAEAAMLQRTIEQRRPEARRLLDVACGTGEHLCHLRQHFDVTGVDASEAMLQVARRSCGCRRSGGYAPLRSKSSTPPLHVRRHGAPRDDDGVVIARHIARHLEPGGMIVERG